jgi:hypothetical protein
MESEEMKLATPLKYVTYAVVCGHGEIPRDMLRYDHCFPFEWTCSWPPEDEELNACILQQHWESDSGNWNPERWRSFGWSLLSVHTNATDAAIAVLAWKGTRP